MTVLASARPAARGRGSSAARGLKIACCVCRRPPAGLRRIGRFRRRRRSSSSTASARHGSSARPSSRRASRLPTDRGRPAGHRTVRPQPGRSLLDWPRDVAELADHLGIERFSIVAWSGGGPYGLACGFALLTASMRSRPFRPPRHWPEPTDPGYLRRRDRHAVRAAGRAPWSFVSRCGIGAAVSGATPRSSSKIRRRHVRRRPGGPCRAGAAQPHDRQLGRAIPTGRSRHVRRGARPCPAVGLRAGQDKSAGAHLAGRPRRHRAAGDGQAPRRGHPRRASVSTTPTRGTTCCIAIGRKFSPTLPSSARQSRRALPDLLIAIRHERSAEARPAGGWAMSWARRYCLLQTCTAASPRTINVRFQDKPAGRAGSHTVSPRRTASSSLASTGASAGSYTPTKS